VGAAAPESARGDGPRVLDEPREGGVAAEAVAGPMKPRKPLPRSTKPLPRSTKPIARSALKPRKAKPKSVNHVRRYKRFQYTNLSQARNAFVRSLPCRITGMVPSDPAHVLGIEGMRLKGHYTTIAPLSRAVHDELDNGKGRAAWLKKYGVTEADVARWTVETEAAWQAWCDGGFRDA